MCSLVITQYESIKNRLHNAAQQCGRDASKINLITVSKTWDAETLLPLIDFDKMKFGENKPQELINKAEKLAKSVEWHFIGRLQTNKIRKILPFTKLIHSVDRVDLANQINRISGELNLLTEILLQVNTGEESSKAGFSFSELKKNFDQLVALPNLNVRGLMCIPPWFEDPEEVRPHFRALRNLRDELATEHSVPLPELSMGMSHDFEVAIQEGATFIRVGSAIFGERPKAKSTPI